MKPVDVLAAGVHLLKQDGMALAWTVGDSHSPEDLAIIAEGVLRHGRALAQGGDARSLSCLVREDGRVVAGGLGRTEFRRLFVSHLWVVEERRRQGLGRRVLAALEAEAAARGCHDALIETLDDAVADLYARLGYRWAARVPGYVGPFTRHVMIKPLPAGA